MIFDLHTHSKYSFDSLQKPEKMLKVAYKKGLDGIAITDHGTIRGGLEALKCKNPGVKIIVGSEISTEVGHILCLFLNEEIKSKSAIEVIEEVKEQDGMTVLAHPFQKKKHIPEMILKKIDAIEGYNGRTSQEANIKAMELAKKYRLPITAGSDAHFSFEIGNTKMILESGNYVNMKKTILANNTIFYNHSIKFPKSFSRVVKLIKTKLI
ncbi:PHP domain-containing protein [Methanolobus sp. ZRKC3]|uniref:PHP domain-containing protein n=1 Tax=Methanolobus sp. ZRKC3 TaxID=3125786 RepID=UPI0032485182